MNNMNENVCTYKGFAELIQSNSLISHILYLTLMENEYSLYIQISLLAEIQGKLGSYQKEFHIHWHKKI